MLQSLAADKDVSLAARRVLEGLQAEHQEHLCRQQPQLRVSQLTDSCVQGALQQNLVADKDVSLAARRVLESRFRLGVFDPPQDSPWASLGAADLGTPEHLELANEVAAKGRLLACLLVALACGLKQSQ